MEFENLAGLYLCDYASILSELPFVGEVDRSMIRGFFGVEVRRLVGSLTCSECQKAMLNMELRLINEPIKVIGFVWA